MSESPALERIGLFGGTFNPPHLGHLRAARACVEQLGLSRLFLIPTNLPPHKPLPQGSATPAQRLEMARLMAEEIPNAQASDIELRRQGPSYTCDTVEQVQRQFPAALFWLVMGTDMFLSFHRWREPRRIANLCRLAVVAREPGRRAELQRQAEFLQRHLGARCDIIDCPVTVLSSTQVRSQLPAGGDGDVPPAVGRYIRELGLYTQASQPALDLKQLRALVRERLTPKRYRHTLGVEEMAAQMALRFGEDEQDARVAALLHDVTKRLSTGEQLKLCEHYGIIANYSESETALLHADTAAAVAKDEFGVSQRVASAIASHTTGAPNMAALDKIIYLADCIEPGRDYPGVDRLRQLCQTDLDEAMICALQHTIRYVQAQGKTPNPRSQQALNQLIAEKETGK